MNKCDCGFCNRNNEDTVAVKFTYRDNYGEIVTLEKEVPEDYLGLTQMGVLCELFRDFLYACGFTFVAEDNKVIALVDERDVE